MNCKSIIVRILFKDKTNEKNGDPILYNILKSKLNSIYGILVMKWIKDTISEDYITGEYTKNNDIEPFMVTAFMGLAVIPHLKITTLGLVDVDKQEIVPLFVEEN